MSCSVSVYLIVSYSYAENTETELQSFIIHSNLLVLKLQHIYSHLGICLQFLQMELQIKSAHSRTSLASILSRLLFVGVMLRYSGQLLLRLAAEGISLARFRPIVKKKKKRFTERFCQVVSNGNKNTVSTHATFHLGLEKFLRHPSFERQCLRKRLRFRLTHM